MGYTHYWERDEVEVPLDLWNKALARIRPVLERNASLVRDASLSDDAIYFNGDCETFYVQRVFQPPYEGAPHCWSFCKTRGGAYDPVVVACLLILADTLADVGFRWSSDGNWPQEHTGGIALAGLTPETAQGPAR